VRPNILGSWAIAAFAILASCSQSGHDPSDTLVGAETLPPVSVLARETIQINRNRSVNGEDHYLTIWTAIAVIVLRIGLAWSMRSDRS
jgi:hypothetical protein